MSEEKQIHRSNFNCKMCGRDTFVTSKYSNGPCRDTEYLAYIRQFRRYCYKCNKLDERGRKSTIKTVKKIFMEMMWSDPHLPDDVAVLVERSGWHGDGLLLGSFIIRGWYHGGWGYELSVDQLNLLKIAFESIGPRYKCQIRIVEAGKPDDFVKFKLEIEIRQED